MRTFSGLITTVRMMAIMMVVVVVMVLVMVMVVMFPGKEKTLS